MLYVICFKIPSKSTQLYDTNKFTHEKKKDNTYTHG